MEVGVLIMEEAIIGIGTAGIWNISVPSAQFCYEHKTVLEQ